jgi:endoglucanase
MTHVEEDFTMQEDSDPAPRLCFNMGLLDMEQEPGNHTVQLDNVKLVVKDISGATAGAGLPEYPDAVTNQVGFRPSDTKHVIVRNAGSGGTFRLINDRSGETVLEGQLGAEQYDEAVREKVRIGDFSSFGTRGIYHIRVNTESCEQDTPSFAIGNHVYDRIYKDTLRMFSLHRCGTEVTAQNEEFSHVRCHGRKALLYGTDKVIDVSGGWHDAADYGRYVVSGAKAVADLLWAYEDCGALGDDTGIPESNNRIPDILDEVRYELDWMLKMQDPVTGGVHHKVSCKVHPDNIGPEEETEQLVVAPVSTTATGDFAAVMAKASVIYKKSDPVFSKKALAAAKKAFAFIKDKEDTTGYKNPGDIVTDEYADKETSDEILWAAAELYLAGEEDCADVIRKRWDPERTDIGLGWADVAGYACWDLLKADGGKLKDVTAAMKEKLLRRADELVEKTVSSAYGCSLGSDFFRWSNMTAANNGMLLEIAARVSGREKYRAAAHEQVGYLLGENPLGCCFVTGWGAISPLNPHHRPSQKSGRTMKGMLVGGPDKNLEDSYAKAVLAGQPDGMCYVDSAQSYSTNDVAIYLNSPLVYLLAVR